MTFDDFKYPVGALVQFRAAPTVRATVAAQVLMKNDSSIGWGYILGALGSMWSAQVERRSWYGEEELELADEAEARKS